MKNNNDWIEKKPSKYDYKFIGLITEYKSDESGFPMEELKIHKVKGDYYLISWKRKHFLKNSLHKNRLHKGTSYEECLSIAKSYMEKYKYNNYSIIHKLRDKLLDFTIKIKAIYKYGRTINGDPFDLMREVCIYGNRS